MKIVQKLALLTGFCAAATIFLFLFQRAGAARVKAVIVRQAGTFTITPEDFAAGSVPVSFVPGTWQDKIDTREPGSYVIHLKAGRLYCCSHLVVIDTIAPVIRGVHDITIETGENVRYRDGVHVSDNSDSEVELQVSGIVDNETTGTYTVTYIAEDPSGNSTQESCTVTVAEPNNANARARGFADDLLSGIIDDRMTDLEKLTAIHRWFDESFRYSADPIEDGNFWESAAYGLGYQGGDCYSAEASAAVLMTQAGIKNKIIDGEPYSGHCWNLVDLGDGWHHFDVGLGPKEDRDIIYLTTSLLETKYAIGHQFEEDRYPDIVP